MVGPGIFFGDTEVLLKTNKRKATAISKTTKLVVYFIEKEVLISENIILIKKQAFYKNLRR